MKKSYKEKWIKKGKQDLLMEHLACQAARERINGTESTELNLPIEFLPVMLSFMALNSLYDTYDHNTPLYFMGKKVNIIR